MKAFARLIDALRPWLDRLVIVGGWLHRMHRFHPLANPPASLPLTTRDADPAISARPSEPLSSKWSSRASMLHRRSLGSADLVQPGNSGECRRSQRPVSGGDEEDRLPRAREGDVEDAHLLFEPLLTLLRRCGSEPRRLCRSTTSERTIQVKAVRSVQKKGRIAAGIGTRRLDLGNEQEGECRSLGAVYGEESQTVRSASGASRPTPQAMDAVTDRSWMERAPTEVEFRDDLPPLRSVCRWTHGYREFGPGEERKWNEIQNTSEDVLPLWNCLPTRYEQLVWDRHGRARVGAG